MAQSSPNPKGILDQAVWLRRLAASLVDDPNTAEDIAQSTYAMALERPPSHASNLRGWLAAVMTNLVRERLRGEQRRTFHERRGAREEREPSSSEVCERLQMQSLVVDAVTALPEKYRRVVMLRYFDNIPPREIARMRSVPVATVNSQLARAMQMLRESLDESHGGERCAWSLGLLGWLGSSGTGPLVTAGVSQ